MTVGDSETGEINIAGKIQLDTQISKVRKFGHELIHSQGRF